MPICFNFVCHLIFGALMAIVFKQSPVLKQLINWQMLLALIFTTVLSIPITTYLFLFYPHWSLLYLFDPQLYPMMTHFIQSLSSVVALLHVAIVLCGFYWARYGIMQHNMLIAYQPIIFSLCALCLLTWLFASRLLFIDTFDNFWQGSATPLIQSTAGWLGMSLYIAMFTFILWLRNHFHHRDPKFL